MVYPLRFREKQTVRGSREAYPEVMNNHQSYIYSLDNYQAISEARLKLDGITVLAGPNGCGKSTLSRWLYYLVNTISQFDKLVTDDFISRFYSVLLDLKRVSITDIHSEPLLRLNDLRKEDLSIDKFADIYTKILRRYYTDFLIWNANKEIPESEKERVFSFLNIPYSSSDEENEAAIAAFYNKYMSGIKSMSDISKNIKLVHPQRELFDFICRRYNESRKNIPSLQLSESGNDILKGDSFNNPYNLKKAIYIDTPMALGHKDIRSISWTSLQDMMVNESRKPTSEEQRIIFYIKKVIDGTFSIKENIFQDKEIRYVRRDGLDITLERAATGLNAFAYLLLLLQNGHLDSETLLLIDEPEAHLHPQWIVEFARVLVTIHKRLGVNIMIASHNPDMVSAISSIAKREEIEDETNFYLAVKENDSWQYTYKSLGTDISDIFRSFNIALSRIREYGE